MTAPSLDLEWLPDPDDYWLGPGVGYQSPDGSDLGEPTDDE